MVKPIEKPCSDPHKPETPQPCDVCGKVISSGALVRYYVDGYRYGNEDRFACIGECSETAKVELALIYGEEPRPPKVLLVVCT